MARFPLKWLFILVAIIAAGLAALMNPNDVTAGIVSVLLLLSVFFGVVCVAARRSTEFWSAYVGVVFVFLVLSAHSILGPGPRQPTIALLDWAGKAVAPNSSAVNATIRNAQAQGPGTVFIVRPAPPNEAERLLAFKGIGQMLFAMTFGTMAGWIAVAVADRRPDGALAGPAP